MHSQNVDRVAIGAGKRHRPGRITPPIDIIVGAKRVTFGVLALPNVDDNRVNQLLTFERRLAPIAIGGNFYKGGPRLGGGGLGVGVGNGSACQKKRDHTQTIAAHQEDRKCRQ